MGIIIFLIVIIEILKLLELYLNTNGIATNSRQNNNYNFNGKLNSKLLTNNELNFYYKLKYITDKYNFFIFPKVRLADIITTHNYSDFNRIKSKHIDFTICDQNTKPILFIELDDSTHNNIKNKENDAKKDYIMQTLSIAIIRVKLYEIDEKLNDINDILRLNLVTN